MTQKLPLLLALCMTSPAFAEETRQLDAHEHGVGQLDIAVEGSDILMELHAPGADIVGFEYEAESAEDLAAIDAAIATLAAPLSLFQVPEAAGCSVIAANAELESEGAHDDEHDHDDHDDHDDHKDDDHADHDDEHKDDDHADHDDHDDHKDDDHADHDDHDDHKDDDHDDHDDHKDDDHAEHDDHDDHKDDDHAEHDDHDHDEHADHEGEEEGGHTEFHAEYLLNCTDPSSLTQIEFAYFETFPNALEVEVQILSASGATAFEVERDAPTLDTSGQF